MAESLKDAIKVIIIIIISSPVLQPIRHVNVGICQRYFQMSSFSIEMCGYPVGIITLVIGFQGCIITEESETFHKTRCIQMLLKQFPPDILNIQIKPHMNKFEEKVLLKNIFWCVVKREVYWYFFQEPAGSHWKFRHFL